jgi:hypothetical protein
MCVCVSDLFMRQVVEVVVVDGGVGAGLHVLVVVV